MRFHVVSLPHTQVTEDYAACAFTEKVRKFCRMLYPRNHEIMLYAGERTTAPCDELVTCITEDERRAAVGDRHYTEASFDHRAPHWRAFNARAFAAIRRRAQPHDFVCVIGGTAHKPLADMLEQVDPTLMTVEFGVGYGGIFARHRVFESYAWMHACYAQQSGSAVAADGKFFDTVIPNYIEPEWFPYCREKGDYYLYIGRLTERKGYAIAVEACRRMGRRLVVAGPGAPPPGVEYVGVVGPRVRGLLMASARAVFVPTLYLEPFGTVAVEAMACGTPVITTDWGAFTETVQPGITGLRCRTLLDFCQAIETVEAGIFDPATIRAYALDRYALDAIAPQYEDYFRRLSTLWADGWYHGAPPAPAGG